MLGVRVRVRYRYRYVLNKIFICCYSWSFEGRITSFTWSNKGLTQGCTYPALRSTLLC